MGKTLLEEKGSEPMESVEEVKRKNTEKEGWFGKRYRFEIKLRCVKLHLEEGLPISLLSKEVGASTDGIRRWVKAYQERGEVGLQNPVRSSGRWRRLPGPVRKKILQARSHPSGHSSGSLLLRQYLPLTHNPSPITDYSQAVDSIWRIS